MKDSARYEGADPDPAAPLTAPPFDDGPSLGPADELGGAAGVFFAELVFGRSLGELEGMMLLSRLHRFLLLSWGLLVSSVGLRGWLALLAKASSCALCLS